MWSTRAEVPWTDGRAGFYFMFGSQFSDRNFLDEPLSGFSVTPNYSLDAVIPLPDIVGLVGGDTYLDGLPTADNAMVVGQTVILSFGSPPYGSTWQLFESTATTSIADGRVRPTDYNVSTNPVVWFQL